MSETLVAPVRAFTAYEHDTREFVTMNQALVDNGAALFPTTARGLRRRDARLRALVTMPTTTTRPAHSALALPDQRS